MRNSMYVALAAMAVIGAGCGGGDASPAGADHDAQVVAILDAADARPVARDSLAPIVEGLTSADAMVRIHAVRVLGRLERPELVATIRPLLDDREPVVRAEAANALAQAVLHTDSSDVRALLLAALERETEPDALGVIAQSLGRLRMASAAAVDTTTDALVARLPAAGPLGRIGVAKGLYHLARQPLARDALPARAVEALRGMLATAQDSALLDRRVRTVAAAALVAARAASMDDYLTILADADEFVRREGVAGLPGAPDEAAAHTLVSTALRDVSPVVRYEALRAYDRQGRIAEDCAPLVRALDDPDAHVVLYAIDRLPACGVEPARLARLDTLATLLPAAADGEWHRPAHALVALAALDGGLAASRLPPFAAHANPFVRTWAARAAAAIDDGRTLLALVEDSIANVRIAALQGLADVAPDSARAAALRVLQTADGELAMLAARVLEDATDPTAPARLFDALERLTASRRETSRDPRVALLGRIGELATAADSARLRPLLRDYDRVIADSAAALLTTWTGVPARATPEPLPRQPFPTVDELRSLAVDTVEIALVDGSIVLIRLHPWDAPTNAARFARLARDRELDGLTIHRVVPNFVIQGGSPQANEYIGAGPYSRDEVGIDGNWRGTVGLSTRGHDTGDGQFYVNLVDNLRLDHAYTVFGEVVSGMDVVRNVLEGARMQTVRVR